MPHFQKDRAGAMGAAGFDEAQFAELKALLQPGFELSQHMLADYKEAHPDKFEKKPAPASIHDHRSKPLAPAPAPNPAAVSIEAQTRNNEMQKQAAAERAPEQTFKVNDETGEIKPPEPVDPPSNVH